MKTPPTRRLLVPALVATGALAATGCESRLGVARLEPPRTIQALSWSDSTELTWSAVPQGRYAAYYQSTPGVTQTGAERRVELDENFVDVHVDEFETLCVRVATLSNGTESDLSPEVCARAQDGPLVRVPAWTLPHAQDGDEAGTSMALGDPNGDGFPDLAVGAPLHDDGLTLDAGRVTLHLGGPAGFNPQPAWEIVGEDAGNELGTAVAFVDYDRDGREDLFIGEPGYDFDRGIASGIRAEGDVLAADSTWLLPGVAPGDRLGSALVAVETPATSVVIVGGPGAAGGSGFVAGYQVSGEVFSSIGNAGDELGASVACGDIDGNGLPECIAGAPGGDAALLVTDDWFVRTFSGPVQGERFGAAVALGTTDTGVPAIIVGAPLYDAQDLGAIYQFSYSAAGGGQVFLVDEWASLTADAQQGLAIAIADVNGNDVPDAVYADADGNIEYCDILEGGFNCYFSVADGEAGDGFGRTFLVTDLDGDGSDDLFAGAPSAGEGEPAIAFHAAAAEGGPEPVIGSPLFEIVYEAVHPIGATFLVHEPGVRHRCRWEWGDGSEDSVLDPCTPATASSAMHTYEEAGVYEVRLTVTANGRDGQAATTVTIEDPY